MTSTERLIEAIEYSYDTGEDWWDTFDSIDEAIKILNKVKKETPEEYQIAHILSFFKEEEEIYIKGLYQAFIMCINRLKKELKELEE